MIDKLATEILIRIFSYLTNHQKRECILTCQHWRHVIESSLFLTRVYLTEDIQPCFERIKQGKLNGTQTRTLLLDQCSLTPEQLAQLPVLFPHLEHLVLCDGDPDVLTVTAHETNLPLASWSKSLTSIVESTDYMFSFILLREPSVAFQQLTCLSLAFRYSDHVTQKSKFFQSLHRSPIQQLELACIVLSLEEMETLHENTPLLNHLVLTDSTLIARQGFQPSAVRVLDPNTYELINNDRPATKLVHVEMEQRCRFYQSERYWMNYMAQKYPNLKSLVLDCLHPHRGRELLSWTIRMRHAFATILLHCPHFDSFYIKSIQLNREFINIWRPHSLKQINWIVPDDQSTLPALSKTDQEIESIHLCLNRIFSHANIMSHLQFVSKILVHLKHLFLEGFSEIHEVLNILTWFPLLETITFERVGSIKYTTKVNEYEKGDEKALPSSSAVVKRENDIQEFGLKSIKFIKCGLNSDDRLLENISKQCPSIRTVKIMDCDLKRFYMPYSSLNYLELNITKEDEDEDDDQHDVDTQEQQQAGYHTDPTPNVHGSTTIQQDVQDQDQDQQQQQQQQHIYIKTDTLQKTFLVQFIDSHLIIPPGELHPLLHTEENNFGFGGHNITKVKQKCIRRYSEHDHHHQQQNSLDDTFMIYCKHILNLVINHTILF